MAMPQALGSRCGADRAAVMLAMIATCRLNDVEPIVFANTADLPTSRLHELLPWEWACLRRTHKPADRHAA